MKVCPALSVAERYRKKKGAVPFFNGVFHWNGSTGGSGSQLSASYIPAAVQKALGVRLK